MNLHTSKAIIAEAERLKKLQQAEFSAIQPTNSAHKRGMALARYEKLAVEIADFIRQEVIPTKNADLMLAVSSTFARIELLARPDDSLLNSSLQNSVKQCAQAMKSRKANMRDLASFAIYEASYQDSQRTPHTPTGAPIDAVHKFVSAERARHNNSQLGRTLAPALIEEAKVNIDLCDALLRQHKIEQRAWLAKLQEQQNSVSIQKSPDISPRRRDKGASR
ncbi:MAG: hypothetical protein LBP75_02325 [Planctomycetota bacterium]|jgi:hypothetical protein|nr:hypothetical protein [Planctomycetota bacterium]